MEGGEGGREGGREGTYVEVLDEGLFGAAELQKDMAAV